MSYYQNISFMGDTDMKIFISWSGNLSKRIAESLKTWLPCFIQSIEVFFSPEDIEKGDNWDNKISGELSNCKYGIICLTQDNVTAPWINFEAGAIAKSLDSRVATLMINVNPSDIKGPLSRYQATKFEKNDFFQLISDINNNSEKPLDSNVLENSFNSVWEKMIADVQEVIAAEPKSVQKLKKESVTSEAIEEILQLLRKQNSILLSPEQLIPIDYFDYILKRRDSSSSEIFEFHCRLTDYMDWLLTKIKNEKLNYLIRDLSLDSLLFMLRSEISKKDKELYHRYRILERRLNEITKNQFESDNNIVIDNSVSEK